MNLKNISKRRFIVMLWGLFFIANGIALLKLSTMGNDPGSAFVMAWADVVKVDFVITNFIFSTVCFIIQLVFGRRFIGLGTFATWIVIGPVASYEYQLLVSVIGSTFSLPQRVFLVLISVLSISLGAAFYQTADMGISPYDSTSIILSNKFPVPYFWCRIFTDAVCTILAFLLGGIVGFGTLVSALGLGPFIAFFTKHIAVKLCNPDTTTKFVGTRKATSAGC